MIRTLSIALALAGVAGAALGQNVVLKQQPADGTGALITSAYWDPDGSDFDELVWDAFTLSAAANVTEIRWTGGYGTGYFPGAPVSDFEIAIYASIPAGTQPDLGFLYPGPLVHYIASEHAQATCHETPIGVFGDRPLYSYSFTLPRPFLAAANTKYWVYIIGWEPSWPVWGRARATGGDGSHFTRAIGMGDFRYFSATGDTAFELVGQNANCSAPTVTSHPQPQNVCFNGASVSFSVQASGTGTLQYRWRLNGAAVFDGPNGGGHGGGSFIQGATTNTLTIIQPSYWADVGNYDCVVTNACGPTASQSAPLTVDFGAPGFTAQPAPASVCDGGTLMFTASPGASATALQWLLNGLPILDGVQADGAIVSGATADTLFVDNAGLAEAGVYSLSASNACGESISAGAQGSVCLADYDCSGFADSDDFVAFAQDFSLGCVGAGQGSGGPEPACLRSADADRSGFVDSDDFVTFVQAFVLGC